MDTTYIKFRIAILLVAAFLGVQSVWILCPEFLRADVVRLPTNLPAAIAASKQRNRAAWAATLGAVRGELWAQSAFTYADLMFGENEENGDVLQQLACARVSIKRTLYESPVQSPVWLLRAGLAARYPSLHFSAMEALRMSYYTGPSEADLIPLRLRLAVVSSAITDADLRPLMRRDLRLLLARKQQAAIVSAYDAAAPPSKRFIEQALADIDRSALESLRTSAPKPSLPD